MLKDVISQLDYSHFDEIAVVMFAISFLAIIWGALRLRPEAVERFSSIPIHDHVVDPRKGDQE
ncbi:hypothetical protein VN12_06830 [Pirellula sp. SH-Sr6A]|jgi:hypothetical protein|uniref:hypothetical protein n=1 Tax=Pirellula sp. SH-Sr6A TaxID=1632865 RepID=UPI00078C5D09|nr:hypothetical protein [Pirellula sp. SH-Sr6A]AMV31817.1 hypothetical protein VN12_06830 [Pirellula sp. SH-Sr6A]